jgi:hypothetical protein
MNNNPLEYKLTPAAKEVLFEMVEDYKIQLLKEANKSASDITGEVREISVRDLLETLQKFESPKINKRAALIERILIIYVFIGILTALIGYIFTRYTTSQFSDTVGLAGSLLALLSLSLYFINTQHRITIGSLVVSKRDTSFDTKDYSMLFPLKWIEIETLSKEVIAYYIGESNVDKMTIRDLINNLQKFHVLNSADSELFLRLLEKRNSVVHSRAFEMSATEYKELEDCANIVLKKLQFAKDSTSQS